MKIAGVVVTYNRKQELLLNVNQIINQTKHFDRFYIIDNCSTDGTYESLVDSGMLKNSWIEFVKLPSNIGGAGGFYEGVKHAYQDGYDFICLMDDDGRPANNDTINNLYKVACQKYETNKKMMINSLVISFDDPNLLSFGMAGKSTAEEIIAVSNSMVFEKYINPFNGTIITKDLVDAIGFPNRDFFIRGDEVDYQSRAVRAGAYIATVCDSLYNHPRPAFSSFIWRGKKVDFEVCAPWKSYYLIRNYTYRLKRDRGLVEALKNYIFVYRGTLLCSSKENKKKNKKMLRKGFLDGLKGRLGFTVKP